MALTTIDDRGLKTPIDLIDNEKIRLGTGNDLEVYHNGTDSFIKSNTNKLRLLSDKFRFNNLANDETFIYAENGAQVQLYYDGVKKFETLSGGAHVTGLLSASGNINITDSGKFQAGDSQDLKLYHDGTNNYIDSASGQILRIRAATFSVQTASGTEAILKGTANGSVELYWDNAKKFETYEYGVTVTGNVQVGTHAYWVDSGEAIFGAGSDLKIYHDGTHSYLKEAGTGNFYVMASTKLQIDNSAGDKTMAAFHDGGAVELFYDNAKKFETKSDGILVTGEVQSDTLDCNGNAHIDGTCTVTSHIYQGDSDIHYFGTGNDLEIFHNGSNSKIHNNTGRLDIEGDQISFWNHAGNETLADFNADGAVELYHNNIKTFETTSSGIKVLGPDADYASIDLYSDEGQHGADMFRFHVDDGGPLYIKNYTDGAWENHIQCEGGGAVTLYHNNSEKLKTTSTTVSFTAHARPSANDTYDVGLNGYKWDDVYATNGTIQTSDRNTKNTIVDSDLGLSFVNKLKPVSYKFNNKTRTHYGLISQDIETVLSDISKPTVDFAGFIKEDIPDELYNKNDTLPEGKKVGDVKVPAYTTYGLRYNEFISPLIKAVQELSAEVETLKTKVAALEAA